MSPRPLTRQPNPRRNDLYQSWVDRINADEKGFDHFSRGYEHFGFHVLKNGDVTYKEWAPNAVTASLIGDFSPSFPRPHSARARRC